MMLTSLRNVRKLLDCYHRAWFTEVCNTVNHIDCADRSNILANDKAEYFNVNSAIRFLDKIISEISSRFSNETCITSKGLSIVPSVTAIEYKEKPKIAKRRMYDEISYDDSSYIKSRIEKASFAIIMTMHIMWSYSKLIINGKKISDIFAINSLQISLPL